MNPWIAFIIGLFIGANVGLFVFALCQAAGKRVPKNYYQDTNWRENE